MKPDVVHFHTFQDGSVDLVVKVSRIRLFFISLMWQSDDVKVTFEETRNDKLKKTPLKAATTGACTACIAGAANVTVAGTAALANGTGVSTGSVGRTNMSSNDVCWLHP